MLNWSIPSSVLSERDVHSEAGSNLIKVVNESIASIQQRNKWQVNQGGTVDVAGQQALDSLKKFKDVASTYFDSKVAIPVQNLRSGATTENTQNEVAASINQATAPTLKPNKF